MNPWAKSIILFLKGAVLGVSMALPGLSGGTMAFVMGIYENIIEEIAKVRPKGIKTLWLRLISRKKPSIGALRLIKTQQDWGFLIPLAGGSITAIVFFVGFALPFIESYSLPFYSVVSGLITASLLKPLAAVYRNLRCFILFFVSLAASAGLFVWGEGFTLFANQPSAWIFAPAGFLVAGALIVPGISGSYLLVVLGLYEKTLTALKEADIMISFCFFLGASAGGLLIAGGIHKMIKNHFSEMSAIISGLVLSSLYVVFPLTGGIGEILSFNADTRIFALCFAGGFAVFIAFEIFPHAKGGAL